MSTIYQGLAHGVFRNNRTSMLWLGALLTFVFLALDIQLANPLLLPIAKVASVVFLVVVSIIYFNNPRPLPPETWLPVLIVFWSIGSLLTEYPNTDIFLETFQYELQFKLLIMAAAYLVIALRSPLPLVAAPIASMLVVAYAITTSLQIPLLELMQTERLSGGELLENPNAAAALVFNGMVAMLLFWYNENPLRQMRTRVIIMAIAAVGVTIIVASASRKFLSALAVFMILYLLFCYGKQAFRNIYVLAFVGISLVGLYQLQDYVIHNTLAGERFLMIEQQENVDEVRFLLLQYGLDMVESSPIFGVGLGNYSIYAEGYDPHSDFLEVISTTGVFGLVFYMLFFGIIFRRLMWIKRHTSSRVLRYEVGVFQAFIITSLFLSLGRPLFRGPGLIFIIGMSSYFYLHYRAMQASLLPARSPVQARQHRYPSPEVASPPAQPAND